METHAPSPRRTVPWGPSGITDGDNNDPSLQELTHCRIAAVPLGEPPHKNEKKFCAWATLGEAIQMQARSRNLRMVQTALSSRRDSPAVWWKGCVSGWSRGNTTGQMGALGHRLRRWPENISPSVFRRSRVVRPLLAGLCEKICVHHEACDQVRACHRAPRIIIEKPSLSGRTPWQLGLIPPRSRKWRV